MRLIVAHQILIAAGIVVAVLFALRSAFLFGRAGVASDLVLAIVSAVIAGGLALYLRRVRAKWAAKRRQ
jgi:hypothetical protein